MPPHRRPLILHPGGAERCDRPHHRNLADLLWDNGPLSTGTVTRSNGTGGPGVVAAAGTEWSELFIGNTSAGYTVSPGTTPGSFRLADDFTLPAPATVDTVTANAYVTGSAVSALFSTGNIRIWDGLPGAVGSTVLFGDTTTDRLVSSTATNLNRVFATDALPGGGASAPGTTRRIKAGVFDIGGLALSAGTYWVDYQIDPLTAGGSVFHPSVTLTTARGPAGANGVQFDGVAWVPILDTGTPATLDDIPQALAFRVDGTIPEPASLGVLAFAGLAMSARRRR